MFFPNFSFSEFIERNYRLLIVAILSFALLTRVYRLADIKEYIFDEVYHGVTSKLVARDDPRAFEWWNPPVEPNTAVDWLHPPYAKYTQALSMRIFGENSFGWRISSVIFGVLVIWLTILLADAWFENKPIALLAGLLASFDGLLLVQSRIAMNDIHVTFFILLALYFYQLYRKAKNAPAKEKHASVPVYHKPSFLLFLTGLSAGMAMGTKWSGLFVLLIVWSLEALHFVAQKMQQFFDQKKHKKAALTISTSLIQGAQYLMFLIILPVVMYVLAYTQMFLQGKTLICEGKEVAQGQCYCKQESSMWVTAVVKVLPNMKERLEKYEERGGCKRLISHFSELHNQIWWYQTNLKATHGYQSRPFDWFFDKRPVWMYVKYADKTIANIYAQGNPALFWIGGFTIAISIAYILSLHPKEILSHPLTHLLFAYFAVWLPWQISPRIMFFYHYTPAVPLLCIILSYWLMRALPLQLILEDESTFPFGKSLLGVTVAVIGVTFIVFYPNWTGIPVPKEFADSVYFFFKSWK